MRPAHHRHRHARHGHSVSNRSKIALALVGGLAAALVLGVVLPALLTFGRTVTIANAGAASIRLSGCDIDDALDIGPGKSADYEAHGRSGCDAYVLGTTTYLGCLVLENGHSAPTAFVIPRDLDRSISEANCERVR